MSRVLVAIVVCLTTLCPSFPAHGQHGSTRAWQQRIEIEVDLPIPVVALDSANPFAIPVDSPPRLVASTPPKKLDVAGTLRIAAYVDAKGECRGAVPLALPFPGLAATVLEEIKNVRFDPAVRGSTAVASWVVLELPIVGRVKDSTVGAPTFELPDPAAPPEPPAPLSVAPPGSLLNAEFVPQPSLSSLASPRRLKVKTPAQDVEVPVRALVHVTAGGRCDRFVPLDIDTGLTTWLSAYLATCRLDPAVRDGAPHEAWVVMSTRAQIEMTSLESTGVTVVRDRSFEPAASRD
ncbi:MAG: hypothetical protein MUC56_04920 [Thermoanaerobaculales bacterium]|jgi:hypothetical protein|nr:hypothetical protein [Thermoanaerobaculales bacterium]